MLLTTHDLADIEELCPRLMVIDKGKLLFDGALDSLKRQLWRDSTLKIDLKDRAQLARIEGLAADGVRVEKLSDLACRLSFPRERYTNAEVIRMVLREAEILDLAIEEQSIEEVVKRIYAGGLVPRAE